MARFSEYKRQRIVSLWHDGFKAPAIAKILAKENLPATRQGIQKFLKKLLNLLASTTNNLWSRHINH